MTETVAETPAPPPKRRRRSFGTAGLIGPPTLWLVVFFLIPVCIAAAYSVGALSFFPGEAALSLDGWWDFLNGSAYLDLFWQRTLKVALIVSVASILLAYPVAYYIALCAPKRKYVLLLLIIAPYFVSYFLRILAMKVILGDQGVINSFAYWTGLRPEDQPIPGLLYSQTAVIITLVFVFVPLVALPIFVSLENLDRRLLEAATDLGASRFTAFRRVTLPLSMPGVIAGFVFVFVPTLGEYFTPLLVGGTTGYLFGNSIQDLYGASQDWQTGSILSLFLLLAIAVVMAAFARFMSLRSVSA